LRLNAQPPQLCRHLHHGEPAQRHALHRHDRQSASRGSGSTEPATFDGFSHAYGCTRLVWFERHAWVVKAIRREKRIEHWKRDWKLKLIEDANPDWLDLAADWFPRERS
jgi:hypothetical protein